MVWKYVRAVVAVGLIGGGLVWWLHPGIGLAVVGALIWFDLVLEDTIG